LRVILVLTTLRPPYRSFEFRFYDSSFVKTAPTHYVMCSSLSYFLSFNHSKKGGDKKVTSITNVHFRHHFYCLECLLHDSTHSQTIITHDHGHRNI